jgi:amino acid transporter
MLERNGMSTTESLDTSPPAIATTPPDTLHRSLSVWNSLTIGFAVVSPVVGLYAIIGVQTAVTGGGWFAALAICLLMQLLVATVYAELSSQFPIAGVRTSGHGSSGGGATGQFAGVIYISSTIAMLTTTAYTGSVWLAIFLARRVEEGPP